jgi:molecular chaperone DnaK
MSEAAANGDPAQAVPASSDASAAVGIDLGTSTSCVCACEGGIPEILANERGERITPSVVAFDEDGSAIVGSAAKDHLIEQPRNTIFSAKRLIGRLFDSDEVRKARAICAYAIVEGPNGDARVRVHGTVYSLPEISALILREMKRTAETRLGRPVKRAVITVPAYFNDNQRQATKDAGRIAGLDVLRIINEPTAAALAYGYGRDMVRKIAVYDLGGGTFDISILEIGKDIFEVLATGGDTFLGGDDFDDRILDFLADGFVAEHGVNLRRDPIALQKLKTAAERAKMELSRSERAVIEIQDLYWADPNMLGIRREISREDFKRLTQDLIDRTFKVCEEAIQSAGLLATDLDAVILVGGPTRLPLIREAVKSFFGKDPQCDLDPEEVVATGAAIHASSLLEPTQKTFLLDVTPLSLKLGISGGLAETIIEKNTPIPIEQTRPFTTLRDNQQEVAIRIYQGESRMAAENELLGEFEFSGLPPAPRGQVTIEVTFEISSEGIVNVIAKDAESGRRQATTVRLSSGLSEEEIRRAASSQSADAASADMAPAPDPELARRPGDAARETAAAAPAVPADDAAPSALPPLENTLFQDEEMPDLTPLAPGEELTPSSELQDLLTGIEPDPEKEDGEGA